MKRVGYILAAWLILGAATVQAGWFGMSMNGGGAMFTVTLALGADATTLPEIPVKDNGGEDVTYDHDAEDGDENKKPFFRKNNLWMWGSGATIAGGLYAIYDNNKGGGGGGKDSQSSDNGGVSINVDGENNETKITIIRREK